MQHADRLSRASYKDDAICARLIPHPEFLHTSAYAWHRLEIGRLLTKLQRFELKADIPFYVRRKGPDGLERIAQEPNGLHD